MSTLRTYNLQNPDSSNVNIELTQGSGAVVAGVATFSSDVRVSGNLTVDGVLTYDDVTNIDSVGVVTARNGLHVTGGNLGVGLNNPSAPLHLSGPAEIRLNNATDAGNFARIRCFEVNGDNGAHLVFNTGAGEVVRFQNNGNIGIGVTDPSEKLEVNGGKIFIDGGGNRKITLDPGSNATYDSRIDASHTLVFRSYVDAGAGVKTCTFNTNGHLLPGDDNGQDLGASNARWRNIYTGDLNLSNEGSANDVDGTWGQYTIQEGENDLFLINKRTGKKYKFNLTEVD